jgi:DNA-binding transcriptional LysR family regulator
LSEYAEGVRGHVRIHANISAIVEFLPEDLGAFAKLHSHIKIDLQEHLSGDVIRAVHDGAADVGICNQQAELQGLQQRSYRQDKLMVVLPRKHALSRRKHVAFAETLACTAPAPCISRSAARRQKLASCCSCAFKSPRWMRCAA